MSELERNKGKLIPVTLADILIEYPNIEVDEIDYNTDGKFITHDGQYYRVIFEVESSHDLCMSHVSKNSDGTIDFHIIHHNGSCSWTELLDD